MLEWRQMRILGKATISYSCADSIEFEGVVADNNEKSVES